MDPLLAEARTHAAAVRLSLELLHEDAWCAEQRALIASALRRLDALTALLSETWPASRSHPGA